MPVVGDEDLARGGEADRIAAELVRASDDGADDAPRRATIA
jgi:hypothetical protein